KTQPNTTVPMARALTAPVAHSEGIRAVASTPLGRAAREPYRLPARRTAGLLDDAEFQAFGGQLQTGALCRALHLDRDAVLVLHRRDSGAATDRSPGTTGHVGPVEVGKVLQVVDVADRGRALHADLAHGQALDLHGVALPLEGQRPFPPTPPDPDCDRALRQLQRGVSFPLGL